LLSIYTSSFWRFFQIHFYHTRICATSISPPHALKFMHAHIYRKHKHTQVQCTNANYTLSHSLTLTHTHTHAHTHTNICTSFKVKNGSIYNKLFYCFISFFFKIYETKYKTWYLFSVKSCLDFTWIIFMIIINQKYLLLENKAQSQSFYWLYVRRVSLEWQIYKRNFYYSRYWISVNSNFGIWAKVLSTVRSG